MRLRKFELNGFYHLYILRTTRVSALNRVNIEELRSFIDSP